MAGNGQDTSRGILPVSFLDNLPTKGPGKRRMDQNTAMTLARDWAVRTGVKQVVYPHPLWGWTYDNVDTYKLIRRTQDFVVQSSREGRVTK